MDPFDETVNYAHLAPSSPESPLPDLHRAKLQGGTPRYSRTDTLKSFSRAFSASKRLQQMMGLQDPVPFVTPPLMPKGLEQAFLDNLQEFGLDYEGIWMGNGVTHELMTGAGGMHSKLEKSKLPDIIEEAESPTKTTFSTIRIQSPSPKKIPTSRKRASSLSSQELFGPPVTRARSEDSIGLPILPAESEMLWKFKFPGNTHALLTILINWSCTMGSMYNRYPDPKGFPHNAAFPWPIRPPVYQQLISVGFYDTSVTPHKEIRFLGPGDATEIAYAEVDTFRSQEDIEAFQEQQNQDLTGEGRWAYILIKGNQTAKDETPPHLIIAFHHSAVTDESTCLHTILPDDHVTHSTSSQTPPSLPLKRFNSLQNLINASRNPLRLHQALRSASSSELPRADVASIDLQDGAQTLQRTVLKMEKAGGIPLIEGYRVDIGAFRSWLDAVGRGSGKLMMWKEKE
ncbi:hypothetical protein BKA66DRAFT_417838 [Pyrenochaeta sp. MPI-SDFR-AT-0127]|nr:hypothetical protein BKA66DRAFT_417838 [Pyrenochaeta sp. MPI-SDFR-AT-0127]